jgi:hypothetical protein
VREKIVSFEEAVRVIKEGDLLSMMTSAMDAPPMALLREEVWGLSSKAMISQSGFWRRTWEAALIPAAFPPVTINLSLAINPPPSSKSQIPKTE